MDEVILKLMDGAPGWIIAIALAYLVLKSLLPATATLNKANQDAIAQQQSISKNLEDIYDKKLAVSEQLIEQRLITMGMQRDRERDSEIAKLRHEITGLVSKVELVQGENDVLKKRQGILDENDIAKNKLIESLSAQVVTLQANLDAITEELGRRIEQIAGLESRIATLIGMPLPPVETGVTAA